MTAIELHALIEAGRAPVIVDVRTRAEFDRGHVPGAINIPFTSVSSRALEIPGGREAPMVLYCGRGPRARIAAAVLERAGFRDIRVLEGHMAGWRKGRYTEERSS